MKEKSKNLLLNEWHLENKFSSDILTGENSIGTAFSIQHCPLIIALGAIYIKR